MRFRKRPIEVEAWQWDGVADYTTAPPWVEGAVVHWGRKSLPISTLEGVILASPGDWLVRGVRGEVYPVKPDIFAATYEQV